MLATARRTYSSRVARAQLERLVQRHAVGHVAVQRVVRRGLVGDEVGGDAAAHQLGVDVGGVAEQADARAASSP